MKKLRVDKLFAGVACHLWLPCPFAPRSCKHKGMLMNRRYVLRKDELGEMLYQRISLLIEKNRGGWATLGASCGLLGGMLSIVLGSLLWVFLPLLLQDNLRSFLNLLVTVFFVLPFPLLTLGAHCLDLLETKSPLLPLQANSRPTVFASQHRFRPQRPCQN